MPRLVIASRNIDKLREISSLLTDLCVDIIPVNDMLPDFNVIEDQDSILANAAKKAVETSQATGFSALADDTGLFIDALHGDPGVFAARFAGDSCSYAENRQKVLSLLQGIENRKAEFRTVAVLAEPDGVVAYREGIMRGKITTEERGSKGFGYDAIFEVEGSGKTYAEMDETEKNACSHRAIALKSFLPFLTKYFTSYKTE